MSIRPKDIAQYFKISAATVRAYEEIGLIPRPARTKSGYRIYTDEHIAYYACVREMLAGFSLTKIAKMLSPVMNKDIHTALWLANKAQADLQHEKMIAQKMMENLFKRAEEPANSNPNFLTVTEVSRATGVPVSTIRYWDKVGLISATRQAENNYRIFTAEDIKKVHVLYAVKFASFPGSKRYSVEIIRQRLNDFDFNSAEQIKKLAQDFYKYLDNINRNRIKSIAALYRLCCQAEAGIFSAAYRRFIAAHDRNIAKRQAGQLRPLLRFSAKIC